MKTIKQLLVNPVLRTSLLVLFGLEAAMILFGLLHPSFLAIGLFYNFNTLVLPLILFAASAAAFVIWNRRPYERAPLRFAFRILILGLLLISLRMFHVTNNSTPSHAPALHHSHSNPRDIPSQPLRKTQPSFGVRCSHTRTSS